MTPCYAVRMLRWWMSALVAVCLAAFAFALIDAATRGAGGESNSAQSGGDAETAVDGQGAIGIQDVPIVLEEFELFNECRPIRSFVSVAEELNLGIGAQNAVESRMRSARLFTNKQQYDEPYLYVSVVGNINFELARRGIRNDNFDVEVKFIKTLYDPLSGTKWRRDTWRCHISDSFGTVHRTHILPTLAKCLDKFVAEYLRVNESACDTK